MAVMEAIQTVRTESEVSSITFASIPQTYEHLVIRASMTTTENTNYSELYLQVGSGGSVDTGSHYWYSAAGANASAKTSETTSSLQTQSRMRYVGAQGHPKENQGKSGAFEMTFTDYTNTNKNKSWNYFLGWNGHATGYFYSQFQSNNWIDSYASHAGIDTIKIQVNGAYEFQRNSVISLYGLNSA